MGADLEHDIGALRHMSHREGADLSGRLGGLNVSQNCLIIFASSINGQLVGGQNLMFTGTNFIPILKLVFPAFSPSKRFSGSFA